SMRGLARPSPGVTPLSRDATVKDLLNAHGPDNDPRVPDLERPGSTRAWTFELSSAIDAEDIERTATLAVRLLARLGADSRINAGLPFGKCPAAPHIQTVYEIHLGTWLQRCVKRSADPIRSFISELVLEWVLFRHLRVATRKLASQGVSTFKFRPEEGE